MDLIPALYRDDVKQAGNVIWELQTMGSKVTEINAHGKNLIQNNK